MRTKKIKIINKLGLHARASMKLIKLTTRFQSNILIRYNNREINAKSIMNVMVLNAGQGAEIELVVTGCDEIIAIKALEQLINNRFGEKE